MPHRIDKSHNWVMIWMLLLKISEFSRVDDADSAHMLMQQSGDVADERETVC